MIIVPTLVHHHDPTVRQVTTTPVHLLVISFQQTGKNIKDRRPYRIHQLAVFRNTIVGNLQVETVKTKTILMQPLRRGISLPRATMEGFPHLQQFHVAIVLSTIRKHYRLLPVSPACFQVDVRISTVITRDAKELPFHKPQPPAAVYYYLRLSGVIHNAHPAIFQTNCRPVSTDIEHFPILRHHRHSVSTFQPPQSATPVMESF